MVRGECRYGMASLWAERGMGKMLRREVAKASEVRA